MKRNGEIRRKRKESKSAEKGKEGGRKSIMKIVCLREETFNLICGPRHTSKISIMMKK